MNKWYHPFGLVLLTAMVGQLTGCATTSEWLAKVTPKKSSQEKLAAKDREKDKDKKTAAKSSTGKPKKDAVATTGTDKAVAKKSKPKIDSEHEKYTAQSEKPRKKPGSSPDAKDDPKLASNKKPDVLIKTSAKSDEQNGEDTLLTFMEQIDKKPAEAKKPADKKPAAPVDPFEDDELIVTKKPTTAKKEVAKASEADQSDWTDSTPPSPKSGKASIAAQHEEPANTEHEETAAADEGPIKKVTETSEPKAKSQDNDDWAVDPVESRVEKAHKPATRHDTAQKNESSRGLIALCPDARGELRDLIAAIDQNDPDSVKHALHRIGQMTSDGDAAAPLLNKMLKNEDPFVRLHAALALVRLGISAPETVSVVTTSLKSRDASLRSFASAVLGEMGPLTNEALASLAESLNDHDGHVRIRAAEILIRDENWALPAQQTLLKCLKDKDENIRWLTAYSLAELAPETPECVQALIKATKDPVPRVQVGAVYALGEIGPFAKRATDDLNRLLESTKDEELKAAIKYSLEQLAAEEKQPQ